MQPAFAVGNRCGFLLIRLLQAVTVGTLFAGVTATRLVGESVIRWHPGTLKTIRIDLQNPGRKGNNL